MAYSYSTTPQYNDEYDLNANTITMNECICNTMICDTSIKSNLTVNNLLNANIISCNVINNGRAIIPNYLECNSQYTSPATGSFYQQQTSNNNNVDTYTRAGKIRMFGTIPATQSYTFTINNPFVNNLYSQILVWSAQQNQSAINFVPLGVDLITQGTGGFGINVYNNDTNPINSIPYIYYMIV